MRCVLIVNNSSLISRPVARRARETFNYARGAQIESAARYELSHSRYGADARIDVVELKDNGMHGRTLYSLIKRDLFAARY